jgi:hypothetical protein
MSNGKVKLYRNPARNVSTPFEHPVPQYQALGIQPVDMSPSISAPHPVVSSSTASPVVPSHSPRGAVHQPYAEQVPSPVGRGRGLLPNIGNNIEQIWAGVDGEIVDDISLDPNHPMIDNNEFIDASSSLEVKDQNDDVIDESTPLEAVLFDLEEGEYLLLVNDKPLCSGLLEDIQQQVRDLAFGEHPLCQGNPVSIDDILVIKKIKIKVGVFLE